MSELSEVLKLVLVIFLPTLLAYLLVVVFIKKGCWKEKMKAARTLDPEYGLIKQGPLWLSIITPFFYFIALGFIAWQGHEFSLTADGFKTFVSISTFPFLVLSVSIPLAGLVSRIHSTGQTATQIELAKRKNNLDTFYDHRKELFSYFSQIGEVDYQGGIKAKYKAHPRIHKIFFTGEPCDGTPEVNKAAFQEIESDLISARQYIDYVIQDIKPSFTFDYYLYACSKIYTLGEKLGLPEITKDLPNKSVHVPIESKNKEKMNPTTVGVTTDELVETYAYARNYFLILCDFASYAPQKELYKQLDIGEAGDKYKNIMQPLVVERLHETIIKEYIAKNVG